MKGNNEPSVATGTSFSEGGDQRLATHFPAAQSEELQVRPASASATYTRFRISDIFSAWHHTNDFCECRAEYITVRLRLMAFFFAVALPAYIPVDYYTLTSEHFPGVTVSRCLLSLAHVIVGMIALRKLTLNQVNLLLGLDVLATSLFYLTSLSILQTGGSEVPPVGYSFMPYLMVVMIGLFPLTLLCSFLIMLLILGPFAGMILWQDNFGDQEAFDMLFLFVLFMGVVLWLQSGQLIMLLRLYRESTRDMLTGLINRRVLMRCLDEEVGKNRSEGRVFSILMIDLDRFKRVNDRYGHFSGDLVLKEAARQLEKLLRSSDIVARFGGEEFVVVLPGLGGEDAVIVAQRICSRFRESFVYSPDGIRIGFTSSIGVSEYVTGEKLELTLKRADDALYGAKEEGRNRVIYIPRRKE